MAIIGISLIVASVVLFCLRPKAWLPNLFANLIQPRVNGPASRPPTDQPQDVDHEPGAKQDDNIPESEENGVVSLSPSLPPSPQITIQEPLVDIEDKDASEEHVESQVLYTEDSREQGRRDEEMLGMEEEEEEEEEEQTTPTAFAAAGNETVPDLILPGLSITTEPDGDNVTQQPPPSFTMTPPPTFNIEPAASPEPPSYQKMDVSSEEALPVALNIEPYSGRGATVEPEQNTSRTASQPQLNIAPAQASKTASDLMPPPPLPNSKLPKPRTSGIPLPASSSSPARRSASLNVAGRSSPTPSRLPSPPTAPRNISPTTARIAKSNAAPAPAPTGNRIPTLSGIPRRASPTPTARNLPLPRRGGASSSSGLMPPPTATSIPKKPSRQVSLQPGHSPLDWARLAQAPTSDLRNLPPDTPYLRVTPSMLKQYNGRKGKDAWSAFGGKVYNITPYIAFHPGGGPELLRGAGKDGTRLFAEVHPWVNYETMLQSCLIGLLVDESETGPGAMEEMD